MDSFTPDALSSSWVASLGKVDELRHLVEPFNLSQNQCSQEVESHVNDDGYAGE